MRSVKRDISRLYPDHRGSPDAGGGCGVHDRRHVLPPLPTPRGVRRAVGARRSPRRPRGRLDRLHQGRRRLAVDRRRLAPVPRDHQRPLRRRLAGRRRHDDRPHRRAPAPARPPGQRAGRLRHPGQRHPAGSRQDLLRPLRPGHLAGRHEGRLHVPLHDPEPEPDLLPADLLRRDQRGRHRLLVGRPPDRLGRPGARQAHRLAQPGRGSTRTRRCSATRRTCRTPT